MQKCQIHTIKGQSHAKPTRHVMFIKCAPAMFCLHQSCLAHPCTPSPTFIHSLLICCAMASMHRGQTGQQQSKSTAGWWNIPSLCLHPGCASNHHKTDTLSLLCCIHSQLRVARHCPGRLVIVIPEDSCSRECQLVWLEAVSHLQARLANMSACNTHWWWCCHCC